MAIKMKYGAEGEISKGGGGGGGLKLTALWTNPNPTSSFAAQTVPLSSGASEFTFLAVEHIFSASDPGHALSIFPVASLKDGNECAMYIGAWGTNRTGARRYTLPSETSVTFTATGYNGSTNNGYCIPQKIYGIK